jgi:large subunit ribosomal protein L2
MATKQLKPTTPGQRHRIAPVFDEVTTDRPLKSLTKGIDKSGADVTTMAA